MPPQKRRPKRDLSDLTGLRVALYCRVSQEKDSDDRATREKSVDDQEAEGLQWVARHGAILVRCGCGCGADSYRDSDRSASRYATKEREHYAKLCGDIEAGRVGAVWFWEQSRSSRELDGFTKLRKLCRDHNVLWIIRDKIQDPDDYRDMTMAAIQAVISEQESEQTSERVTRGMRSLAVKGQPHGRWTYGYERKRAQHRPPAVPDGQIWLDDRTRQFVWQAPDIWDGDGRAVENSPAWVVREIFSRLAAGDPYSAIIRDLDARGVPTAGVLCARRNGGKRQGRPPKYRGKPQRWTIKGMKTIASNPAYIGGRVYRGEILEDADAKWPPLVDADVFWKVQKRITATQQNHRWGAARHLLSCLAMCDVCGAWLARGTNKPRPGYGYEPVGMYGCRAGFCAGIKQQTLDEYVERVMVEFLSDPEVYAYLTKADDSATAMQARAEADQLRTDLADWRSKAKAGEVSASFYAEIEQDRLARIAEADKRAEAATIPPILEGKFGPQAKERWESLDLAVKRQMITAVAEIRLKPVGRGVRIPVQDRVIWRPLLGPGAGQDG
jgi:site-specific DNA recombinase